MIALLAFASVTALSATATGASANGQVQSAPADGTLAKADKLDEQTSALIEAGKFRSAVFSAEAAAALRRKVYSREISVRIAMVKCLTNLMRCLIATGRAADEEHLMATFQAYVAPNPADGPESNADYAGAIAEFKRVAASRQAGASTIAQAPKPNANPAFPTTPVNSLQSVNPTQPANATTPFSQAAQTGGSSPFGHSAPASAFPPATQTSPFSHSAETNGSAATAGSVINPEADALDAKISGLMTANDFRAATPIAERAVALRQSITTNDEGARIAAVRSFINLLKCYVAMQRTEDEKRLFGEFNKYAYQNGYFTTNSSGDYAHKVDEFNAEFMKVATDQYIEQHPNDPAVIRQKIMSDPNNHGDPSTHPSPTGDPDADALDGQVAVFMLAKNFKAAVPLAEKAFARRKAQRNPMGLGLERSFNNLYMTYRGVGRIDDALNLADSMKPLMNQTSENPAAEENPAASVSPSVIAEETQVRMQFGKILTAAYTASTARLAASQPFSSHDREADELDAKVAALMGDKKFEEALPVAQSVVARRKSRSGKPDLKDYMALKRSNDALVNCLQGLGRPGSAEEASLSILQYMPIGTNGLFENADPVTRAQAYESLTKQANVGKSLMSVMLPGIDTQDAGDNVPAPDGDPESAFGVAARRSSPTVAIKSAEAIAKLRSPTGTGDIRFFATLMAQWQKQHGQGSVALQNFTQFNLTSPAEEARVLSGAAETYFVSSTRTYIARLSAPKPGAFISAMLAAEGKTLPAATAGSASSLLFQLSSPYLYPLLTLAEQQPSDPVIVGRAFLWTLQTKGEAAANELSGLRAHKQVEELPRYIELTKRVQADKRASHALQGKQSSTGNFGGPQADLVFATMDMDGLLSQAIAKNGVAAVLPEDVRRALPPHSALVEFIRYENAPYGEDLAGVYKRPAGPLRYGAFVLSSDASKPVEFFALGDAKIIDDAISAARAGFLSGKKVRRSVELLQGPASGAGASARDFAADDRRLYNLVFAPFAARLGQIGAHELIIAPDGPLSQFPFEALIDPRGKYLLEKYTISYITTGRDLLRPASAEPGAGVDIFCAPDFDAPLARRPPDADVTPPYRPSEAAGKHFQDLPGLLSEGHQVEGLMAGGAFGTVHLYSGAEASEDNLRSIEHPRILHVATHGYYFPPTAQEAEALVADAARGLPFSGQASALPDQTTKTDPMLRSGFVLAGANNSIDSDDDGWITAKEIGKLDLDGTELVVLSACNTGLGDLQLGEGAQGMCRSFLRQGVRGLVLSLFPVPDRETEVLMHQFYTNLRKGEGARAALRAAQMAQLQHDPTAAPVEWASFVYLGAGVTDSGRNQ